MLPWLQLPGGIELSTYYASIAVGLSLAIFVVLREATHAGIPRRAMLDVGTVVIPAGAVVARWFVVFDDPWFYVEHPARLLWPKPGLVSFGALAGLLVGVFLMSRWRGLDPWRVLDVFAPAAVFGHAFARMGCLAAGCCHGRPADWPLGVEVPWAVRYLHLGHVPEELLVVPLHPSPLYEALWDLLVFVGLVRWQRRPHAAGTTLAAMLMAYTSGRFAVEFTRGDLGRGFHFDGLLSTGQVTSLVLFAAGLALLVLRRRACSPS